MRSYRALLASLEPAVWLSIAATLAVVLGANLYRFADIGLEPTDSAYWLENRWHPHDIENQLTLAGVMWNALFGKTPVVSGRLIHYALLFCAGAALVWGAVDCLRERPPRWTYIALATVGGLGYLLAVTVHMVEFSSYSGVLIGVSVTWIAFSRVMRLTLQSVAPPAHANHVGAVTSFHSHRGLFLAGASMGAGALFTAFSKPPTALLMAILFASTYCVCVAARWLSRGQSPDQRSAVSTEALLAQIRVVSLGVAIGVLALLSLLWARGFSPLSIIRRMSDGYQQMSVIGVNISAGSEWAKLLQYLAHIGMFTPQVSGFALACLSLGLSICVAARYLPTSNNASAPVLALIAAMTAGLFLVFVITAESFDQWWLIARLNVVYLTAIACVLLVLLLNRDRFVPGGVPLAVLAVLLPYVCVSSTGSLWFVHLLFYAGIPVAVLIALVASFPPSRRFVVLVPAICLLLAGVVTQRAQMINYPWMNEGKLTEATERFLFGPNDEPMRAPKRLAQTYQILAPHKWRPEGHERPPFLLNLTGRIASIGPHLGLRPPKISRMLVDTPEAGDRILEAALMRLSATELAGAWIFINVGTDKPDPRAMSVEVLNAHLTRFGLKFPDDYRHIVSVPIAHTGQTGGLYRPNKSLRGD